MCATSGRGRIAWSSAHAWKVCEPERVPWVRIPPSPPFSEKGRLRRQNFTPLCEVGFTTPPRSFNFSWYSAPFEKWREYRGGIRSERRRNHLADENRKLTPVRF